MLNNPAIPFLAISLTNGSLFIGGYARRTSLTDLKFIMCDTQLSLYKCKRQGSAADFPLFWTLCSHASPNPIDTELEAQGDPLTKVSVKKCIRLSESAFVYEAKLIKDPGGKGAASPLYFQLAALGRFVIRSASLCTSTPGPPR